MKNVIFADINKKHFEFLGKHKAQYYSNSSVKPRNGCQINWYLSDDIYRWNVQYAQNIGLENGKKLHNIDVYLISSWYDLDRHLRYEYIVPKHLTMFNTVFHGKNMCEIKILNHIPNQNISLKKFFILHPTPLISY